jgi:hypothetical protein
VSCGPSGGRPFGEEYGKEGDNVRVVGGERVWEAGSWLSGLVPGWTPFRLNVARYQSRFLSDNGRVFFDSRDALVPADVNGTWDVYEWEPVGVGGCRVGLSSGSVVFVGELAGSLDGGCVGLVSSGESSSESAFLDASVVGGRDGEGREGGGDVFFLTTSRLSKADFDNSYDVYDAHECSDGVACFGGEVEVPPACSSGDGCRPPESVQPELFGAPSSATFSGPGNVTPGTPAKVLTKAEELSKALGTCKSRYKKQPSKRSRCEAAARKKFGSKPPKKKSKSKKK